MLDNFEIDGSWGKHQCIVQEPLLTSLLHFQVTFDPPRLNKDLVRGVAQQLLLALDFLHTEAHVTHTDIQAKNIIIGSNDTSVFVEWYQEEESQPSARKMIGDQIIYQSRPFRRNGNLKRFGLPILSDFGEARIGDRHQGSIQPDMYRAPEVLLGMEWTSKADIWNVGVLMWDLLESRHLLDARGLDGRHSAVQHLAEMVALLRPPPLEFLQRSSESANYWTAEEFSGYPPDVAGGLFDVPCRGKQDCISQFRAQDAPMGS